MAELFLELFSEEIPARMQAKAGEDLARLLTEQFAAAGLKTAAPIVHTGPRRLAVAFADLPERTEAVREERKGPRVGAPEKAVEGFLKSAGLASLDQCQKQSDAKGEFYVAAIERPGRAVRDLLAEIVLAVCDAMPWPKSMRSGARPERWVRPLQRIVCLLGGAVVTLEWAGVRSGDQTEGHRVHGRGPFTVTDFASWKTALETQGHVRVDRAERRALIIERARAICRDAGLELVEDEALLDEVAGLAEWPVPLLGEFDPAYLDLPPEAIQLTMAKNQKYFAVRDPRTGSLAPRFVAVADLEPKDGGKASAKGYARVLSARLSDARFFWDEDRARSLESRVADLEKVVFHRKLGSVKDKAERVSALARELAPLCGADPQLAARAGLLAKADLTTSMVQEFTDLQGVMGAYYALHDAGVAPSGRSAATSPASGGGMSADNPPPPAGEGDHEVVEGVDAAQIAQAIREHYSPLGPSDAVPTAPVSIAVALADKLDTLVAFWAIDEKPTGSKDPYALRRAALGVIRIVLENGVRLSLQPILVKWMAEERSPHEELGALYKEIVGANEERLDEIRVERNLSADLRAAIDFINSKHSTPNVVARVIEVMQEVRSTGELTERYEATYKDWSHNDWLRMPKLLEFFAGDSAVAFDVNRAYQALHDAYAWHAGEAPDYWDRPIPPRRDFLSSIVKDDIDDLLAFFADRLKVVLRDEGVRHDLIDAVFAPNPQGKVEEDLVAIVARVRALQSFLATPDGENLLAGFKRAGNILDAEAKKTGFDPAGVEFRGAEMLQAPEERALAEALDEAAAQARAAVEREDYEGAMRAIAPLRPAIDAFFDKVTVNSADPELRANRLKLLSRIREALGAVADFSRIGG